MASRSRGSRPALERRADRCAPGPPVRAARSRMPGRPATRPETSPTATDTTGVWHASASFTTTGAPSHIDVSTATSAAFIASATSLRDRPSRLAANAHGVVDAAARPSRRRRRRACSRPSCGRCGQPGTVRRARPAASPRRAAPRRGRPERTLQVDGARDHRRIASPRLAAIDRRDRDRLCPPRHQPRHPALPRHPRVAAVERRHDRRLRVARRRPHPRARSGRGRGRTGRAAGPGEAVAPPPDTGPCGSGRRTPAPTRRPRGGAGRPPGPCTKQPKCGSACVGYMLVSTSTRMP